MIRKATNKDKTQVVHLLKRFYEEYGAPIFDAEIPHAARLFEMHQVDYGLCLVLERDGVLGGVLMAFISPSILGFDVVARETLWWVDKEYRGIESLKMLDEYEKWAKFQGCSKTHLVSLYGNDVSSIYMRKGYKPIETHFWKAI